MSWTAPLAFGWLALALLVLLFYWLRPRRQRIVVASILLWQRTLRRQPKKGWLEWLKRHLLLILQLLAVVALVLALARPEREDVEELGPPVAVVIDASLSMRIEDVPPNRLEAAKNQAIAFVRGLPGDARIAVIAAAGAVRPLVIASTNRLEVETAVAGIEPSATEGQIAAALDTALSLAPADQGGSVALFSDGSFEPPSAAQYQRVRSFTVAGGAANVALETFAVRRRLDDPSQVQGLVAIRNYGAEPVDVEIVIRDEAEVRARQTLEVPAGGREVAIFDGLDPAAGYEARISREGDALLLDNQAFAELAEPRELLVLVAGDDPEPIVRALQALPGITAARAGAGALERTGPHDIYIFQGWVPESLPAASIVLVRPPETGALELSPQDRSDSAPLPGRESPLLAFLDPVALSSAQDIRYAVPAWAEADLTVEGAATLAHGVHGGRRIVLVGLDVAAPLATLEPWYPVLWNNIARWADPFDPLPGPSPVRPQQPVVLVPHPQADTVEIVQPDGASIVRATADPVVLPTEQVGAHVVRQFAGEELLAQSRVAVAPPPGAGAPNPTVQFGEPSATGAPSGSRVPRVVDMWPLFVALAIVFLMTEWWWFHRVRGLR